MKNDFMTNNRPLIYNKNGCIGLSKIDGTPIILPNQYVMPKLSDTLMHFCYSTFLRRNSSCLIERFPVRKIIESYSQVRNVDAWMRMAMNF